MKKGTLLFLFIIYSLIGSTQQLNDSIIVYIDNQLELLISIDDYDHLRDSNNVSEVLTKFQSYLVEMSGKLDSETADLIIYYPDSSISLEKGDQKNVFLIEEGELRNTGFRDQATIQVDEITITLTAKDLAAIQRISLTDCYEKMILLLPEKSRYARTLYYQCNQGKITGIEENNYTNYFPKGGDVLEITAGVGASLVKNQLVGDFTFKLGFGFSKKGVFRSPYASVNLMYDFSDGNKMHVNTFLNVGHDWELPKKLNRSALVGLELGYLISRNGELFEENTFRFGLNYALPSGFNLSPQVYMGDGFKRFYPGIRMGFAF